MQGGQSLEGLARGVDADGALLLEVDGARRRILSGEVSVGRFGDRFWPCDSPFALLLFANIAWYGWTHWVARPTSRSRPRPQPQGSNSSSRVRRGRAQPSAPRRRAPRTTA